jgi:hypothetical protein
MAAFVIHTPPGLSRTDLDRAADLGPSLVASDAPLGELLESAGFENVQEYDLTAAFEEACETILHLRDEMEDELRRAEGDPEFEEQCQKKRGLLEGIRLGVLRRTLYVGRVASAVPASIGVGT